MSDLKLKAGFWVRATVRQCAAQGLMAVIARMGDEDSGAIMVKVYGGPANCRVFSQVRDVHAQLAWMCATGAVPVSESEADQLIAKAVKIDSDVWVLEIEDQSQGAVSILGNVLGG